MHRTKFKYENKRRAIAQKLSKQELRFMGTALPFDKIYQHTNFITIATIALEVCTVQDSSIEMNKGQQLKN